MKTAVSSGLFINVWGELPGYWACLLYRLASWLFGLFSQKIVIVFIHEKAGRPTSQPSQLDHIIQLGPYSATSTAISFWHFSTLIRSATLALDIRLKHSILHQLKSPNKSNILFKVSWLHVTVMIPNFSTPDCNTCAVSYYTSYMWQLYMIPNFSTPDCNNVQYLITQLTRDSNDTQFFYTRL